ncbi:MAG TPA: hypothetical protein VGS20_17060 [Candidatus Acidoferrales bacterium]|nr:hypothetical protein [Candidatus Acidoferrales bacterium]
MKRRIFCCSASAIFTLGLAASAWAQAAPATQGPLPLHERVVTGRAGWLGNPLGDVFYFSEPLSGLEGQAVTGAPFSAQIVNETVQVLADGNRIDRKSAGAFARDSVGRTRREMSFEAIGPLAAEGKAPRLAFISDPAAGKVYTLDETRKTAEVMSPPSNLNHIPGQFSESHFARRFAGETKTESLGQKTIEGLAVQGTRVTRIIPAGEIGNEKPIAITIERWYSPDLQTTILLTRSDPRFGTTTYQLTDISREEPPQALFMVPPDYAVKTATRPRMRIARPPNDNPGIP